MAVEISELTPPVRLAVAHARRYLRAGFSLLLQFDQRLSDIVGRASEPMIAQMKFAWWYDVIERSPAKRPSGEPLLAALNEIDEPRIQTAMLLLLDAWGGLLAANEWQQCELETFAKIRSDAVFATYADLVGSKEDIARVGAAWAITDLRQRFGTRVSGATVHVAPVIWLSRKLRPLSILARSVTSSSGARIVWHALTGR